MSDLEIYVIVHSPSYLNCPLFPPYNTIPPLAGELIRARIRSGLTQKQLAEKMGTTQSSVARLESGSTLPSLRSLKKYASATGSRIRIFLDS